MIELDVTPGQALQALARIRDEYMPAFAYALAKQMAFRLLELMQLFTPVRTGNLRTSEDVDEEPGGFWVGTHSVSYAKYVAEGTPAHDIYPVNKKALAWKGGGHPVTHVHHPGTEARPFHLWALRQVEQESPTMILAMIARYPQAFGGEA